VYWLREQGQGGKVPLDGPLIGAIKARMRQSP
jgi:hypothetical protein